MTVRPLISPHDQNATFVELFFDLVFVFGITQVVGLLHHGLSWTAAAQAVLVFWMIWWGWTQFTWALNASDTTHPVIEFSTLSATAIAFFMAVAVPDAFVGGALWFAGPYVALRLVGLALYTTVMWQSEESPGVPSALFATASLGGFAAVIIGAFSEDQAMFWGLAIFLDVMAGAHRGEYARRMGPSRRALRGASRTDCHYCAGGIAHRSGRGTGRGRAND